MHFTESRKPQRSHLSPSGLVADPSHLLSESAFTFYSRTGAKPSHQDLRVLLLWDEGTAKFTLKRKGTAQRDGSCVTPALEKLSGGRQEKLMSHRQRWQKGREGCVGNGGDRGARRV